MKLYQELVELHEELLVKFKDNYYGHHIEVTLLNKYITLQFSRFTKTVNFEDWNKKEVLDDIYQRFDNNYNKPKFTAIDVMYKPTTSKGEL